MNTTPQQPQQEEPNENTLDPFPSRRGLSRRGLLGLMGASAAAGFVGGGASIAAITTGSQQASPGAGQYPFFGEKQAGVTTAMQDRMHFASFDMTTTATRNDLIELLQDWTYAASRLTRGLDVSETGAVAGPPLLPPDDTGEALGLPASNLTITFGFGPTLFTQASGTDRFGIAHRKPSELTDLPLFAFDILDPKISGGDLCIQACADDPQVAVHAIRNLSRIAFGRAQIRWSQLGFGRTSSTSRTQQTPRNLFGFKDGTANIVSQETDALVEHVYEGPGADQSWMNGGTYLIVRKIQMLIESWDRVKLQEQETIIGRNKSEGAPLSGGEEFTEPNFTAVTSEGGPAIPLDAHVRLAHPQANQNIRIMRRGYNYVDGSNELGQLNAGLFFISFQRSPRQFITVQKNLTEDTLNEYIRHIGSALFAIPRGVPSGSHYIGEQLFER
ncbi:iron uptake transporter deferrochelatase/peroxidase subunit [Lysinibacter sp. HNR]|uniref:iron uptake transporter deferrochelatase/peroxidase subunit n=1 Tax=Lysinibacter sp. HNR TaxID=3031408 RepID=UPI0024347D60|nr:iron uptake transporter deferrochelatase/peroxidase subunit [Lysinibacter sp. HNR]WGD38360.1 iron uptake transporter deferrochelatase/peroxidase subunit [Lysinibacter sp. HNR]